MKAWKRNLLIVFAVLLLFWGVSLAKCEYLTWRYATEFENLWEQTGMLEEPDYCKVLEYNREEADVYYVNRYNGGTVLRFVREESGWTLEKWIACWSRTGNADDLIWPYLR